jgi:curved DNA-binding protein CbpA
MCRQKMYDFYKILEISRDANTEDIRKAYRNKAKLVHPDVNSSPKANEVFGVVNEAYEVLMDEQKRYLHDVQLNQVDSAKADAERKKHYYGSSVKNDSYSNPNFHYDWNGFKSVYRERTDEDYYKRSPFFYNAFFASGIIIGIIIILVTVTGTFNHYWPSPFILMSICGFILVKEGWRGLRRKKSMLNGLIRLFRKTEDQ